ncbi:M56 family metallopeptidase [Prosthecobacter fluviatilis]|uniref:M56 family metallopeptidase n=1 Tax=Prosthecobacter fluviatilis TaxID=445931 RepID=A0ABW0KLF9_9BACT
MNTLTHIFDWLLAASLRASLLTAATLLIQAALHRHLSARMRYALWLPTLVVLLMPVLPESRWSLEQVFQAHARQTPVAATMAVSDVVHEMPVVFSAPEPLPPPVDWQHLVRVGWLVIAAGILLSGGVSLMLALRRFQRARHPASDEILATLAQIAREVCLRRMPEVLISPGVSSPAVTGLLHPVLLLPVSFDHEFTPAEARLVLKHELMHLKRGDLTLNALMCFLMALHWFNPLLWIAFFKIRADREAACDAQVLHDATKDHRAEYGHALLKVESAFCPRGLSLGFVGIFQRGAVLRSRIQSIISHPRPRPVMRAVLAICIILMTFFGVTRAQKSEPVRDFTIGQLSFREGDSIQIHSVQTTAESLTVSADYVLASEDEAYISLFVTVKNSDRTPVDPRQRARIKKGKGSVVLVHPHPQTGLPHLSFYNKDGEAFGGIYFGTQDEAAASKAMNLNYMKAGTQTEAANPYAFIKSKLDKIIIPSIQFKEASVQEALEYLRVKGREFDTLTTDPKARGVSILYRAGDPPSAAIISLDLKDIPLSEALRYVVELANLKMSVQPYAVVVSETEIKTGAASSSQVPAAEMPSPRVIIPSLEMREASLNECLDFIRNQSRELDPERKGVNIILQPGGDTSANITLSLKDVPVDEALRYCAELGHHKLTHDARSYVLIPESKQDKSQASSPSSAAPSAAEAEADKLRKARPQKYEFAKARLGDVLRYLATDAGMNFISPPDDNPINQKLVTFSIHASPFDVLETLCGANGLTLVFDRERWIIRPSEDADLIGKFYSQPKTQASAETILKDISTILNGSNATPKKDTSTPSVTYRKEYSSFYVKATRLQHSWVSAYFKGLTSSAQPGDTE